jgi:hypothetical protein
MTHRVKMPFHLFELAAELEDVNLRAHARHELVSVDRLRQILADALVDTP